MLITGSFGATVLALFFLLLGPYCNNYALQDKLSCPGCSSGSSPDASSGNNPLYTPCTNCRIFVSGTTPGNMSGSCGGGSAVCGQGANGTQKADFICQNDAARPDISRTWKALIADTTNRVACANPNCTSGTSGRVNWILKPNTSYYRSDGVTPIMNTDTNGVFVFGSQTFPIDSTVAYNVWTGLNANWTTGSQHCLNWGSSLNANAGGYGTSSLSDGWSIATGSSNTCDTISDNLYCVEQ